MRYIRILFFLLIIISCVKEEKLKEVQINITIVNGGGDNNAAIRFSEAIGSLDSVSVVSISNAKNFVYSKTKIIARNRDINKIKMIKNILKIKEKDIDFILKKTNLDFEIILGNDYKTIIDRIETDE